MMRTPTRYPLPRWLAAPPLVALTPATVSCQPAAAGGNPSPITTTATATPAALEHLKHLTVAPEDTGAHYRREEWPHLDHHARDLATPEPRLPPPSPPPHPA